MKASAFHCKSTKDTHNAKGRGSGQPKQGRRFRSRVVESSAVQSHPLSSANTKISVLAGGIKGAEDHGTVAERWQSHHAYDVSEKTLSSL